MVPITGNTGLDGRIAIVTGAGRGLGREHALFLAHHGARVIVNDIGCRPDDADEEACVAQDVAAEIRAQGGEAVAFVGSAADFASARCMVQTAIDAFGGLDVLVNNAGNVRDRMLVNMSEADWDAVIDVHLKGHFAPTRWALAYWRDRAKANGAAVDASVVNTSSVAGLAGSVGQANYGAAKSAIATFTIVVAMEARRHGVRVNAIAPVARTRITQGTASQVAMEATIEADFDAFHAANISPLVAHLASPVCPVTGGVFHVAGRQIGLFSGWRIDGTVEAHGRWDLEALGEAIASLVEGRGAFPSTPMTQEAFADMVLQGAV